MKNKLSNEHAVEFNTRLKNYLAGFISDTEQPNVEQDYIEHTNTGVQSYLPLAAILSNDDWSFKPQTTTSKPINNALANIKHIVAIASGKGGVGKSTTTVNTARALASMGATVGILDADIYGPSIPMMLERIGAHPDSKDGKIMEPLVSAEGIKSNSIGYLVDEGDAAVWRGPMASKALMQLFSETRWGQLDYLLIDLPPGTGDIQLTLSQQIPLSGAVIVSTPQDIALIDARKAHVMFEKVDIKTLGLVENMSVHICEECGYESALFGTQGAENYAREHEIPFLGNTPLTAQIRQYMDKQDQISLTEQPFFAHYENIAMRLAIELAKLAKFKADTELSISFKQL